MKKAILLVAIVLLSSLAYTKDKVMFASRPVDSIVVPSAERISKVYMQNEDRQELDDEAAAEIAEEAKERRTTAELQASRRFCGNDFGAPKIGMSMQRAEQCIAKFSLINETKRSDGVYSSYRGGSFQIHALNGIIVAWYQMNSTSP